MSSANIEFQHIKQKNDDWDEYRQALDKYDLRQTHMLSLGELRNILFLKKDKKREYEMLQCSRGMTITEDLKNIDDLIEKVKEHYMVPCPYDLTRIKELEIELDLKRVKSVFEMGFRVPKLLCHYKNRGIEKVAGHDVVKLNVFVAKKMGFDVKQRDYNDLENLDLSDLRKADLVLNYHVIEHVSRPDLLLKKIFNNMKKGAHLHIEVPIEPYGPYLEAGHLYPFHQLDLFTFLIDAGFDILSGTTNEWVRDLVRVMAGFEDKGLHPYETFGVQRIDNYQHLVVNTDTERDQFGRHFAFFDEAGRPILDNDGKLLSSIYGSYKTSTGVEFVTASAPHAPRRIKDVGLPNWIERYLVRKP